MAEADPKFAFPTRSERIAAGERIFDTEQRNRFEPLHPSLRGPFAEAFADLSKPLRRGSVS